MAAANSCWVIGRPRPRSEPSTARRERSLSPSFIEALSSVLQYAKYILQYVSEFARSVRARCKLGCAAKPNLFRLAQGLQVDSQLLALLVKVAAFQSQRSRHVGHMKIVAPNFREHHFPFERFRALG